MWCEPLNSKNPIFLRTNEDSGESIFTQPDFYIPIADE